MGPAEGEGGAEERAQAIHRQNLDAFGGRAARLCSLMRHGRLTPERCYVAVSQLWIQVVRSERRFSGAGGEGTGIDPGGASGGASSGRAGDGVAGVIGDRPDADLG